MFKRLLCLLIVLRIKLDSLHSLQEHKWSGPCSLLCPVYCHSFPSQLGSSYPVTLPPRERAKEALYFTLFLFENLLQLFHMVDSLCSFRSQIKFHLLKIVFPCHDYLMSPPNLPCTCLWITFTLFKRTFFFLFPF